MESYVQISIERKITEELLQYNYQTILKKVIKSIISLLEMF